MPNFYKQNITKFIFHLGVALVWGSMSYGVDFIKVGNTAQIIEIALSIFVLRPRPTFEKVFIGVKVWAKGVGA